MENSFISALRYLIQLIESFIAETAILLLLFGLVFLLIGLFIIIVTIINVFFSPTVNGRVAGAVKAIKNKEKLKDGKLVKESKERLYPIFEYPKADGSLHHIRGSSAGTHVLKYKTGQDVKLVINNSRFSEEATASDVGNRTGWYLGLFFSAFGSIIIYMAADILTSLTISVMAIVGIAISLLFKRKGSLKPTKVKKEIIFDLNDMKPIEDFTEESS